MLPSNTLLVSDNRDVALNLTGGGFLVSVLREDTGDWTPIYFSLRLPEAEGVYKWASSKPETQH